MAEETKTPLVFDVLVGINPKKDPATGNPVYEKIAVVAQGAHKYVLVTGAAYLESGDTPVPGFRVDVQHNVRDFGEHRMMFQAHGQVFGKAMKAQKQAKPLILPGTVQFSQAKRNLRNKNGDKHG